MGWITKFTADSECFMGLTIVFYTSDCFLLEGGDFLIDLERITELLCDQFMERKQPPFRPSRERRERGAGGGS